MKETDLQIARRFKDLVTQKITPAEVRVFGSRARGDAGEFSDLDIFVAIDGCTEEAEKFISDCAWEAGFPEDIVVVPVVVDRDAAERGHLRMSNFIRNVYHEGIKI